MKITFQESNDADSRYVAEHLRPFDLEECQKENPHLPPETAAYYSYLVSTHCCTVLTEGEAAGLLGVCASPLSDEAQIFCFGTPELDQIPPHQWVRLGKSIVRAYLSRYSRLYNRTLEENTNVLKWLKCIGFSLHPPQNGWVQFEIFKQES